MYLGDELLPGLCRDYNSFNTPLWKNPYETISTMELNESGRLFFFSWLNFCNLQLLNDDNRHSPLHLLASDASMQIMEAAGVRGRFTKICFFGRFLNHVCSTWWLNQPIWKSIRQIGSFPQVGVKIRIVWNHHLVLVGGFLNWNPVKNRGSKHARIWISSCCFFCKWSIVANDIFHQKLNGTLPADP